MNPTSTAAPRFSKAAFAGLLKPAVIVAALGYFVDIYDLILFSIVRIPSLQGLGLAGDELLDSGIFVINAQMAGMLVGGVIWGVLGDKRGRISVLFGSILLYSLANIANGFVDSVNNYAALRFVAGIGLAGELGAGITLVSEILPKETRGLGTSLVAAVGLCGAVLAAWIGELFHWRTAYFIGGGLGLALLCLRYGVIESGMFSRCAAAPVDRGQFWRLFSSRAGFLKYLRCILIGVPIWFVIGILVTFSPEFALALGVAEPVVAGSAVMWAYIGLALGDVASGLLSQWLGSRRLVVMLFLLLTLVGTLFYLLVPVSTARGIYAGCFALGLGVGYWAMFVTVGAEQFGTNLRATVTTSVPNFVRGSLVPMTFVFGWLRGGHGIVTAALIVGVVSIAVGLVALAGLQETFGRDLDFVE